MYYSSDTICTNCGFVNKIIRTDNFNKKKFHTYHAPCISCGCYSTFVELGDSTLVKKELEFKLQRTPLEQVVLDLLSEPKCKVKTK